MGTVDLRAAPRILIVDDQPEFRVLAREILECDLTLKVVGEAPEARAALELVPDLMPDLVLMDLDLPVMNGLEAIARFRARFPEIVSVLISVHHDEQFRTLALEAGAVDFITKMDLTPERVWQALANAS